MTAVDTGWITDERPHPTKMRLADEGFHAPLDLVDGAARVYDPIVRGELGEDLLRRLPQGLQPVRLVGDQEVDGSRRPAGSHRRGSLPGGTHRRRGLSAAGRTA